MTTFLTKKSVRASQGQAFLFTLILLAAVMLCTSTRVLAQAPPVEQWQAVPCDENGSLLDPGLTNAQGWTPLVADQQGQAANTYPHDVFDPGCWPSDTESFAGDFPYGHNIVNTPIDPGYGVGWGEVLGCYDTSPVGYGFYDGFVLDLNNETGFVSTSVKAQGYACYKMQAVDAWGHVITPTPAGMPDHIALLLQTQPFVDAEVNNNGNFQWVGLEAEASLTDSLGDSFSFEVDDGDGLSGDGFLSESAPTTTTYHLVQALVDANGIAKARVDVSASTRAANYIAFPGGSDRQITYAQSWAYLAGSSKIPGVDLTATSTAGTVDPHHPLWFSGTNCQVNATCGMDPTLVKQSQLVIGGTIVATYPDPYNPNAAPDFAVAFDSTHFANTSPINIEYKVWDTAGDAPIEKDLSAPVKNRQYAVGNNTWTLNAVLPTGSWIPAVLASITSAAQNVNYWAVSSMEENVAAIKTTLPDYTVFYVNSHGSPGSFGDSFATPGSDDYLDYNDVQKSIQAKNSSQPPYNFVYVDACNSAGDTFHDPNDPNSPYLAEMFLTGFASDTPPYGLDRAYLGWRQETINCLANSQFTEGVWGMMSEGYSLRTATIFSFLATMPVGPRNPDQPLSPLNWVPNFIFPYIYGDAEMKLHGVYQGHLTNWFRRL